MSKMFICSRGDIAEGKNLASVRQTIRDAFPQLRSTHLDQLFSGVPCALAVGAADEMAAFVKRFDSLGLSVQLVATDSKLRALSFTKLNWLAVLPTITGQTGPSVDEAVAEDHHSDDPVTADLSRESLEEEGLEVDYSLSPDVDDAGLTVAAQTNAEPVEEAPVADLSQDFEFDSSRVVQEATERSGLEIDGTGSNEVARPQASQNGTDILDDFALGLVDEADLEQASAGRSPLEEVVDKSEQATGTLEFSLADIGGDEVSASVESESIPEPEEPVKVDFSKLSLLPLNDNDENDKSEPDSN